ncbi:MAG: polyprenyl synthetase family protein, partial [Akkermansiaceae bacterium]|nr:polyprenyl synthetase family protein [Armatimonadota bacterium]
MLSHFTTEHAAILQEVDDFLRTFLHARLTQMPARDHPALSLVYDSIYSYLHNGGRRMHAVSVVLAFEACGGTPRTAILPVAAAFQLYHYHTLVHDDIYDEDDHRRGTRTIHRRFADWFAAHSHVSPAAQADGVFRTDIERRGAIAGWIQGKVVQSLALDALLCAPFACDRLLP